MNSFRELNGMHLAKYFFWVVGSFALATSVSCSKSNVAPALPKGVVSQPEFFDANDIGSAASGSSASDSTVNHESVKSLGVSFIHDQAFCAVSIQVAETFQLDSLAEVPWGEVEALLADLIGASNARLVDIEKVWFVFDRKMVNVSMLAGGSSGGTIPMSVILMLKKPVKVDAIPRANNPSPLGREPSVFALAEENWFAAQLDENTIAIGTEEILKQTVKGASEIELASLIQQQPSDKTMTMAIDMRAIAPTISMMADMARQFGAGEEINRFAAITAIQCQADLNTPELLKIVVDVDDREVVDVLAQMINEGVTNSSGGLGGSMGMLNMADTNRRLAMLTPTISAPAKDFMDEVTKKGLATTTKSANQIQLTLQRAASFDRLLASIVTDAQRQFSLAQRSEQLRKIGIAVEKYYRDQGRFPADEVAAEGEGSAGEGFGWRVQILPQLGYQALYDQFRQEEPWDSEHNLKVAEQIPSEYKIRGRNDGNPLATSFRSVNSAGGLFDVAGPRPLNIESIKDAKNRTAVIIEVADAEGGVWTAPDAILPDVEMFERFGKENEQGVLFVDAEFRVRGIRKQADSLRAVLSVNGRESINRQDLISIAVPERE